MDISRSLKKTLPLLGQTLSSRQLTNGSRELIQVPVIHIVNYKPIKTKNHKRYRSVTN